MTFDKMLDVETLSTLNAALSNFGLNIALNVALFRLIPSRPRVLSEESLEIYAWVPSGHFGTLLVTLGVL